MCNKCQKQLIARKNLEQFETEITWCLDLGEKSFATSLLGHLRPRIVHGGPCPCQGQTANWANSAPKHKHSDKLRAALSFIEGSANKPHLAFLKTWGNKIHGVWCTFGECYQLTGPKAAELGTVPDLCWRWGDEWDRGQTGFPGGTISLGLSEIIGSQETDFISR